MADQPLDIFHANTKDAIFNCCGLVTFAKENPNQELTVIVYPAKKIPTWEQYKYLFGYLGRLLVDYGSYDDLDQFKYSIEMKFNPKRFKYRSDDGQVLEGVRPGSISMVNASRKLLADICKYVEESCMFCGIIYQPFDEWEKENG
jgi:hypothetical protein